MFSKLRKEYQIYEKIRIFVINQANLALHKAKQAIFCFQREEISSGEKILNEAEKILSSLQKKLNQALDLRFNGAYKAAVEEYVEAKLFWQVLEFNKIKLINKKWLRFDDYLAGLCDLTGELVRRMIVLSTNGRFDEVEKVKNIVADIVGELTKINLTGYLRHKYDEAKRNLEKAEQIIYEIKTKR